MSETPDLMQALKDSLAAHRTTVSREEFDRLNEDREPRVLPGLLALGRDDDTPTLPATDADGSNERND